MEILVEPSEMSFTNAEYIITSVPREPNPTMTVERIIDKVRRIKLSLLSKTEDAITGHLTDERGKEAKKLVSAKVVKIHENRVIFALDWNPGQGAAVVIQVYEKRLQKPLAEYTIGEKANLSVLRLPDARIYLPGLPDKVRKFIQRQGCEISYEDGTLSLKGRITHGRLLALKAVDNDRAWHKALDKFYWRTNKVLVDRFISDGWLATVNVTYQPDTAVQAVITEVTKNGIQAKVGEIAAFIPRRLVTKNERSDITKLFAAGDTIDAKVVEIEAEGRATFTTLRP